MRLRDDNEILQCVFLQNDRLFVYSIKELMMKKKENPEKVDEVNQGGDAPLWEAPPEEAPQWEAPLWEAPVEDAPLMEAPPLDAPQWEAPLWEAPPD